ncbi:MAG: hypothetical protein N3G20_03740 [Verrucomicrobiae bacterium]|nr:hypothetical protein [Verrucomicrobiae bacterium]
MNPFEPETIHTGVKMATDRLYTGPRVLAAALKKFGKLSGSSVLTLTHAGL